ncbi:hypothetical protein GCM10010271_67370 [Streptomyces kurssanovii]|nr:hypothetical protein GCM10010271_67370 [Streptomyces kurssanovii]
MAFLPPYGRAANVTLRPAVRPHEIPLNTALSVSRTGSSPSRRVLLGPVAVR